MLDVVEHQAICTLAGMMRRASPYTDSFSGKSIVCSGLTMNKDGRDVILWAPRTSTRTLSSSQCEGIVQEAHNQERSMSRLDEGNAISVLI